MSRHGKALPRSRFTLGRRLVAMLAAIIFLILVGQTLVALSREVTDLDHRIQTEGTILVQSIAAGCAELMDGDSPGRFAPVVARANHAVHVLALAIVDRGGVIIGHTDPARIGEQHDRERFGAFAAPRPSPGLAGLARGHVDFTVSAPVLRGPTVLGFVELEFRSTRISERASTLIASAVGMALVWLAVGAVAGTIYVRRITRPIAELTRAATAISEDRLADAEIERPRSGDEVGVLQHSFIHLLAALRAERAENQRLLDEQQTLNLGLQERVAVMTSEVRAQKAYLESVIRCMEDGVITCDQRGSIVQANLGAHRQLLGLGTPDPGTPIAAVVPDGDCLGQAVRAASTEGRRARLELRRPGPSVGSSRGDLAKALRATEERTILFEIYPLRGLVEAPIGAVVIARDSTEERMMETQLRRHDRLVSLGTIAAELAHELGNYMHTISGFASVLCDAIPDHDPTHADARAIRNENARAIGLLGRFLQFARAEPVQYQYEPIGSIIGEVLDMCAYRLTDAGVHVDADQARDFEREVRCSAHQLNQAFVNIVLNAVAAMAHAPERTLEVRCSANHDAYVEIRFRDTGEGIAREHLDRIFDPFFTTKGAAGTGLGLSIAHKIVDRHGGAIDVLSKAGRGATFRIVLPIDGPKEGDV